MKLKRMMFCLLAAAGLVTAAGGANLYAQYAVVAPAESMARTLPELDTTAVTGADTLVLSLEDCLKIALSENISVKVADQEITRNEYAKKGSYAALFPQVSLSGSYQRTIKKQVMYMDGMSGSGGRPSCSAMT